MLASELQNAAKRLEARSKQLTETEKRRLEKERIIRERQAARLAAEEEEKRARRLAQQATEEEVSRGRGFFFWLCPPALLLAHPHLHLPYPLTTNHPAAGAAQARG